MRYEHECGMSTRGGIGPRGAAHTKQWRLCSWCGVVRLSPVSLSRCRIHPLTRSTCRRSHGSLDRLAQPGRCGSSCVPSRRALSPAASWTSSSGTSTGWCMRVFAKLIDTSRVFVRLECLDNNGCSSWHQDCVPIPSGHHIPRAVHGVRAPRRLQRDPPPPGRGVEGGARLVPPRRGVLQGTRRDGARGRAPQSPWHCAPLTAHRGEWRPPCGARVRHPLATPPLAHRCHS